MRTWTRPPRPMRCGYCNADVPKAAPILAIRIGTVVKYRCGACVGPAPPDLPADITRTRVGVVVPFARLVPKDGR